jgi:hypothetical protein
MRLHHSSSHLVSSWLQLRWFPKSHDNPLTSLLCMAVINPNIPRSWIAVLVLVLFHLCYERSVPTIVLASKRLSTSLLLALTFLKSQDSCLFSRSPHCFSISKDLQVKMFYQRSFEPNTKRSHLTAHRRHFWHYTASGVFDHDVAGR